MTKTTMGKLFVVAAALLSLTTACVVEDVYVDTGGADDTGTIDDDGRPERPSVGDPADEPADAPEPVASSPYVEPDQVTAGEHLLAFVVADGGADLSLAVDVALYGEPDVTVATWAVRDADELALSLEVAASSPAGVLDVVVELEDGSAFRVAEGLTVVR
jgi:hypothetical protein